MTYLITGGAGFIGSSFVAKCVNEGIDVINIDKLTYAGNLNNLIEISDLKNYRFFQGDICDVDIINHIFKNNVIDVIVNFAAETHVDRSILNPNIFYETNVSGTLNLLNFALQYWKSSFENKLFLQISTDEVYGSLCLEDKNSKFTENSQINPSSPYSASKASADLLTLSYFRTYKLPVIVSRCSNNFGARQFPEKLIPLVIEKAKNNSKIPIYGNGNNVRDWLYVDEHIRALQMIIEKGIPGEVYNIGGNNEIANIDLVKMILKIMNKPESLIEYVEDRLGHDLRYALDTEKILTKIGFQSNMNFEKDLTETIHFYLNKE